MANTTNFGWETPDDTDLVKDGAAAIRTLGNSIDTSLVDLKGGANGYILSKASASDMDFTWIANDQGDITAVTAGTGITVTGGTGPTPSVALTVPVVETSGGTNQTSYTTGDLLYASASNTLSKRGIGSSGQVLTVSGGVPTWQTPSSGSFVGCSLYKSANQSIATATATDITFDTESFDTDGFHSTTTNTNRITIPSGKNGKYLITWTICFAANATGIRAMPFAVNGTNWDVFTMNNAGGTYALRATGAIVLNLVATDYLSLLGYQESGGNLDIVGTEKSTRFGCVYLGA